jgi:hypothetical protein
MKSILLNADHMHKLTNVNETRAANVVVANVFHRDVKESRMCLIAERCEGSKSVLNLNRSCPFTSAVSSCRSSLMPIKSQNYTDYRLRPLFPPL